VPSPVFSAHAQHTVLLAPGQALADCLADDGSGAAEEQQLGFEVRRQQTTPQLSLVIIAHSTNP
jgi:hypothetical protein